MAGLAAEPLDGLGDPIDFEVGPREGLGGAGDLWQFGLERPELEMREGVGLGDEQVVDGAGLEIVLGVALEVHGGLLEVFEGEVGAAHSICLPNSYSINIKHHMSNYRPFFMRLASTRLCLASSLNLLWLSSKF